MDCSPPGSFVHGILQAGILEWFSIKSKNLKKICSYFNLSGDVTAQVALQPALKFNGGGHINHSIFWTNLSPNGGGEPKGWFKLGQSWLHFVHSRNDLIFLSYLHSPWGMMMASHSREYGRVVIFRGARARVQNTSRELCTQAHTHTHTTTCGVVSWSECTVHQGKTGFLGKMNFHLLALGHGIRY